jgi:hypothetical protein
MFNLRGICTLCLAVGEKIVGRLTLDAASFDRAFSNDGRLFFVNVRGSEPHFITAEQTQNEKQRGTFFVRFIV